jgi:hypothetical protein
MDEDADDTIPADPDEEGVGLSTGDMTDGNTPDENKEVGIGVGDDD